MGLGPQAWSGGLCHLHSADSDPALRTRWGRMQLLGQCRLTAGAGPCKLCLLRSPLSSAREPHTRLFLPNRLGSVMTVLLEDPPPPRLLWQPLAAPDMDTLSSADSSQLWTKAPSKTRPGAKRDTMGAERRDPTFPRGDMRPSQDRSPETQDITMDARPGVRSPGHPFNLDRHVSRLQGNQPHRKDNWSMATGIWFHFSVMPCQGGWGVGGGICILSTLISIHELIVY